MLLGEHEHSLDDKNRLTLPAKLRAAFEDGVVVTRGLDGCLFAYPRAEWEELAGRIKSLDPLSPEARVMQRHFFAGAAQGELDKQGRMVLPTALIEHAGLTREITVAGVHDHLEIWDRAKWRQQLHEVEGSAEDVAERLAN
ncbi:MAG: division/cell wall cluster transcriptional repressor MraZ [Thermoleophilia bacterium]|nr:division/cell wall cluster transcriptional repressor MraZ [Thermoleophilia bacterium]